MNFNDKKRAALAPMAGVADDTFRAICLHFGAAFTVSEMASAKALAYGDAKTFELIAFSDDRRPFGIQLFGDEPEMMERAAAVVEPLRPDFIDINMGCPAPKIVKQGAGSAVMRSPALAASLVAAVKHACSVPVTVKMRSGFCEINAPETALACEAAGADAVTVHGRTREQMYAPPVDLSVIAAVKRAVRIPVIGNGDIKCGADAKNMFERTGCDMVAVGRASLGNPFIFREISAFLSGGECPPPTLDERLEVMRRHLDGLCAQYGEYIGMLQSRKQAAWYLSGLRGASELRRQAVTLSKRGDIEPFITRVREFQEI